MASRLSFGDPQKGLRELQRSKQHSFREEVTLDASLVSTLHSVRVYALKTSSLCPLIVQIKNPQDLVRERVENLVLERGNGDLQDVEELNRIVGRFLDENLEPLEKEAADEFVVSLATPFVPKGESAVPTWPIALEVQRTSGKPEFYSDLPQTIKKVDFHSIRIFFKKTV